MAAYAALVSLLNNVDAIRNHPRFSTSFDNHQIHFLDSHIDSLLKFVETNNIDGDTSDRAENLRREVSCAAHEAEDIIESHIVNLILPESAETSDPRLHQGCLFGLQKVIQDMDSIKEKVMKFEKKTEFTSQLPTYVMPASSSTPLAVEHNTMVGFDEELKQLKDVLISYKSSRQIISVAGMGGTGKTTLAKYVYEDFLTMHHFEFRAWATISQDYNVRDILLQLLSVKEGAFDVLGDQLYKKLFDRRYLIVLDDVWSDEVWDKINFLFPDNGNGSRVVITTRLLNLATYICIRINFLDEDKSWNLFCQKIFEKDNCPDELLRIGKEIVQKCKGLPLSIVVVGGLLRKSPRTQEYWQSVANNINDIVNSRENGQCLDILYLSYSHLPAHLKPCFLYMGIFEEDSEIRASEIIRLWVAEGFLKPNGEQILEEMAENYLKDLSDRNLILVCAHNSIGKVKYFRIHDLLRELCIKVGDKQAFFSVVGKDVRREHRICVASMPYNVSVQVFQPKSLVRSLRFKWHEGGRKACWGRLLRVMSCNLNRWYNANEYAGENVNLRYVYLDSSSFLSGSISLIWNLQTLILSAHMVIAAPLEIWKLTQLRHLKGYKIWLPDPPSSDDKDESVVMRNLQTLENLHNFRLSEEVSKRTPNIKKLSTSIDKHSFEFVLQNLGRLQRLEYLKIDCKCITRCSKLMYVLPNSLKKLSIVEGMNVSNEALSMGVGSLPVLEVLILQFVDFEALEWNCVEGKFLRLKCLKIEYCKLGRWNLEGASCFPVLEKLVLIGIDEPRDIPSCVVEIPTLQLIHLERCNISLVISAIILKEKQVTVFGNSELVIQVKMHKEERNKLMRRAKAEALSLLNIHLQFYS